MKKLIALFLVLLCLGGTALADVNTATVIPAQEGDVTLELENGTLPLTVYMMDGEYRVRLNGAVTMTKAMKEDIGYWKGGPGGWQNFATVLVGNRFANLRYLVQGDSIYVICTWATKLAHSNDFTDDELRAIAKELYKMWKEMKDAGETDMTFNSFLYACGLTRYEVEFITSLNLQKSK